MKKNLVSEACSKQITRVGVYGVLTQEDKMLLVKQQKGSYAGKFDFPGGGIEFGESFEDALRREFVEEVAIEFDSLQHLDNRTVVVNVPAAESKEPYLFFHIGAIYQINGYRLILAKKCEFQPVWINPKKLSKEQSSCLLWDYLQTKHN